MSTKQAKDREAAEADSIAILKKLAALYDDTQLLTLIAANVGDNKLADGANGPGSAGVVAAEIQRIAFEVQELTRDAYEYLADNNHIYS